MKVILIVAGDLSVRDKLLLMLSSEKFNLKVAACMDDGLHMVWASPPDVVLLDFECPRVNAAQFLEELRNINPSACVVALTSNSAFDKTQHGLKFLIRKPLSRTHVLRTIQRCLAA